MARVAASFAVPAWAVVARRGFQVCASTHKGHRGMPGGAVAYQLEGVLGASLAVVFHGRRIENGAPSGPSVAIKVFMRSKLRDSMCYKEFIISKKIASRGFDGLPSTFAYFVDDLGGGKKVFGMEVMVMERLTMTLSAHFRTGGGGAGDPCARLLRLGRDAVDLLHAFHGSGFLHLDVKPENFLVDGNRLKLCDLGCVREISSVAEMTLVGKDAKHNPAPEGTLAYRSTQMDQIAAGKAVGKAVALPSWYDDLEGLGYSLIDMALASANEKLPWWSLAVRASEAGSPAAYLALAVAKGKPVPLPPAFKRAEAPIAALLAFARRGHGVHVRDAAAPDYVALKRLLEP